MAAAAQTLRYQLTLLIEASPEREIKMQARTERRDPFIDCKPLFTDISSEFRDKIALLQKEHIRYRSRHTASCNDCSTKRSRYERSTITCSGGGWLSARL